MNGWLETFATYVQLLPWLWGTEDEENGREHQDIPCF